MSADRPRDLGLTYEEALHGVQTAVRYEHERNAPGYDHAKHLRVGVNSAHVADAALASLLIARGVFTLEEYVEAQRLAMNEELALYEERHAPASFR